MVVLMVALLVYTQNDYPVYVHYVHTDFGAYTENQKVRLYEDTDKAVIWWENRLLSESIAHVADTNDLYATDTHKDINWLRYIHTPSDNALHVYFVYSPQWLYQAWSASNVIVVYVTDDRETAHMLTHELGHALFHLPDVFNDRDIMGYRYYDAYARGIVGTETRATLGIPDTTVYLPAVIR